MKDTVVEDVQRVVEQTRVKGNMLQSFNATFVSLIPKSDSPKSFSEFRPISLYNSIYKIVAKKWKEESKSFC